MKSAFDTLINRLDMAKQIISELEKMSIEISKAQLQRDRDENDKSCEIITKGVTYI